MLTKAKFSHAIYEMIQRAETTIPRDVVEALKRAFRAEKGRIPRLQLSLMLKNLEIAKRTGTPICQDTGAFIFFIKLGRDLKLAFDIEKALTRALAKAARQIPLRANVMDPISHQASESNDSMILRTVHLELVEGGGLQIALLVTGTGTSTCGRLIMLPPDSGMPEVKSAVLDVLRDAGSRPCPPTIVGVGIGGTMETAPLMARLALTRRIDLKNDDPELVKFEREIETSANELGIGVMGFGGSTTVLRALVEKAPTNTAILPVAVALQCWPARRARAEMQRGVLKVVEP